MVTKTESAEDTTQRRILDIIVNQDDVSWKAIIFGLIETEQMDPWDINISLIAAKFLEELRKLTQMDFRIGGKVVLASAILLKLKAERLRDDELEALETIIRSSQEPVDLGLDELQAVDEPWYHEGEKPQLTPRTPQPRKRKVSVYDLVQALEKALEQDARRPVYAPARTLDTIDPPEHHIDISVIIREVYDRIYGHYEGDKNKDKTLMFHHISRSTDPRDQVMTFIPLLHLESARKVNMEQGEHFGPISIHLLDKTPPAYSQDGKETQTRLAAASDGLKAHVDEPKKKGKAKSTTKAKQVTLSPQDKDLAVVPAPDANAETTTDVKKRAPKKTTKNVDAPKLTSTKKKSR